MLNISDNSIKGKVGEKTFQSFGMVDDKDGRKNVVRWIILLGCISTACIFLPWTQTVDGLGKITALKPESRPQTVPAIIGGRIERWYVREGDTVQPGDTIVRISETKDEYFDPALVERTREQLDAKSQAVGSYQQKVVAMQAQIRALQQGKVAKLQQTENKVRQSRLKVVSDSTDWVAAQLNLQIADEQARRALVMYKDGLIALTDLENRNLKAQEAKAKAISSENKFRVSQNELLNAQTELLSVEFEYNDKLSKAGAELASSESAVFEGQGSVAKLQNQVNTYAIRSGMYFITAPQAGYITKAAQNGLGEAVKAGDPIVTIMPVGAQLAAEVYVAPVDLPLMHLGSKIRLIFDGWPALVFSGWPGISTGTYGGKVVAIDREISSNGKYRILVSPDPEAEIWPEGLRVGSGVKGIALLNDVFLGYELWRRLNGFPPDFYLLDTKESKSASKK
jgi:multidrug efflux pump subunit AcrA (membrane-fusion protein)